MNSMRLKGIHLAMRSGMLAAETAFEAIRAGDVSEPSLKRYQDKIDASPIRTELYPVRNVHQAFGYGLFAGLAFSGLALVTRGRWLEDLRGRAGHQRMKTLAWYYGLDVPVSRPSNTTPVDRKTTFDKVTNVHYSGTAHDEDQPSHLHRADRRVQLAVRSRVRPPVHTVLSGATSTKSLASRASRRSCRSTRRTACTARPATSWIRIRSSPGCRRRAAADLSTTACSCQLVGGSW